MSEQLDGVELAARPFLKWVGGKTQLLPEILLRLGRLKSFSRYHEPFVGGGAVFFALSAQRLLPRKQAYLSDTNVNLVEVYLAVRDDAEELITLLAEHKARHGETYYYAIREQVPDRPVSRAARVIYLNKTCYNGLYRENSSGKFNVPMGRYKNPLICDASNLRAASKALQHAKIEQRSFREVLTRAEKGDLVYFDPPYWPVSESANFTAYAKDNFGKADQEELAQVFRTLSRRGVHALLSNSDTPLVRELYQDFQIDTVFATRNVNSNAARRGKIREVLVRNFGGR